MIILGVSAYYHDSAAVIIKDGKLLAAFEEERFSRIKHDNSFPVLAIRKCLEIAGVTFEDIDYVAYYEKPAKKLERVLENLIATYPYSFEVFIKSLPSLLTKKTDIAKKLKTIGYKGAIEYVPHHYSHAAATYYTSPYNEAAILTVDGVGEYETTSLWHAAGNELTNLGSLNFPNSLGLLYSTFTAFLGFQVNNDEYKMMGLSAYGKPKYVKEIKKMIKIETDGSFSLDMKYFSFRESAKKMWSVLFEEILGQPKTKTEKFSARHKDIAASIQVVTEEIYFNLINRLYKQTNISNLCIGGGVALNSLANGKIYDSTPFKNIHIFGPAGDNGAALGAALAVYHRQNVDRISIKNLYLGNSYSDREVLETIKKNHFKYRKFQDEKLIEMVAKIIDKGGVVGWFGGRMEFGPRALGNRSILSRTYPREMKDRVNEIKFRESFRPFAVSVLQDNVHELFQVPTKRLSSPYMNFCFKVKKEMQKKLAAVVHADDTCRIQTVNKDNGNYYKLISKYFELSGIPAVLNTSFNTKIEPIIESPTQALDDFEKMKLDYLVIENYLIEKN